MASDDTPSNGLYFLYESLAMFAGAMLFGMIPWFLKEKATLNMKYVNWMNIFGAGVFIGCVIMMIMPEGVEQVWESIEDYNSFKNTCQRLRDYCMEHCDETNPKDCKDIEPWCIWEGSGLFGHWSCNVDDEVLEEFTFALEACQMVGLMVLVGFIVNLLCDKVISAFMNPNKRGSGIVVGIGMIIHGMSDGIVMVAAMYSGNKEELAAMIFISIIIHKLPVSFSLGSSIVHQKDLNKWGSFTILFLFALSPCIGGYITMLIMEYAVDDVNDIAPGSLLLMSSGTVIYAACCHILPEAFAAGMTGHYHEAHHGPVHPTRIPKGECHSNSSSSSSSSSSIEENALSNTKVNTVDHRKESVLQLVFCLVGIAIPLIITFSVPE